MGRQVAAVASSDPGFTIVGGVSLGSTELLPGLLERADVLVDFSAPAASVAFLAAARKSGTPAVVGTTGFTDRQKAQLRGASRKIPVFFSPNMSPGMNLVFELARQAAGALPRYDAAISESHHTRKKDAPSGTALRLAEAVREGRRGGPAIPTVSIRAGDIVGDHTLLLAGPDERIELTHRAQSRSVFARGALEAARWLRGRKPGLYGMRDMLGL
jgi:4-hydroxy-tetrahydrodipicolinate reductase